MPIDFALFIDEEPFIKEEEKNDLETGSTLEGI